MLSALATIAFRKSGPSLLLLADMGFFLGIPALALANFISIFILWKKHHWRALTPLGSFALSAVLCFYATRYGTELVLRGTPSQPDSFFNDQTRSELTKIAEQLVGNGFREIRVFPSEQPRIIMIAGHERKDVPSEILTTLRRYGFQMVDIDDPQQIVQFSYNPLRHWYDYTWAKNGLSEPYSMPTALTEVDVEDWKALIEIAREGDPWHKKQAEPGNAYFYLRNALGEEAINRIGRYRSSNEISNEEKSNVLSALNKQVLTSSALAEGLETTYTQTSGLCRCSCSISDEFWVVALLKRLLLEGVLTQASDGQHLKIKANLTDKERIQVEWFHIGLMNFMYGNLVQKRPHPFTLDLGNNWYFSQ
jgi:hypothetical protein